MVRTHVVRDGDRLSTIAHAHDVDVRAILDANPQKARATLASGAEVFASLATGEELAVPARPAMLAGDLFPTIVTAEMVANKLEDTNAKVDWDEDEFFKARTDDAISDADFSVWQAFATRWRKFYQAQIARRFMFDAKSVLQQAEEYDLERFTLREWLKAKAGAYVLGPVEAPPVAPPGGATIDWNQAITVGSVVVAVGAVIYLFGPAIRTLTQRLVRGEESTA